jgi:hypothetical protein
MANHAEFANALEHLVNGLIQEMIGHRLQAVERDLQRFKEATQRQFVNIEARCAALEEFQVLAEHSGLLDEAEVRHEDSNSLQVQLDELKHAQAELSASNLKENQPSISGAGQIRSPVTQFQVIEAPTAGLWRRLLSYDSGKTFRIHPQRNKEMMVVAEGREKQLRCVTSRSTLPSHFRLAFVTYVNWEANHFDFVEIFESTSKCRFDVRQGITTANVGTQIWSYPRNLSGAQQWKIQPSKTTGFVQIVAVSRPGLCISNEMRSGLLFIRETQENIAEFCSLWKIVWD